MVTADLRRAVAVAFAPMPSSQNPNVASRGSSVDTYLRAAFVALASFKRWNPTWTASLVTSEPPSPEWRDKFRKRGLVVDVVPFAHVPPAGFAPTFAGSLFLLDVLEQYAMDRYLMVIDPDVLCVGPVPASATDPDFVSVLEITYPADKVVNRLSRSNALAIHESLGEIRQDYVHYGGEFLGVPPQLRRELNDRLDAAWQASLSRFNTQQSYFTTEEHMLGFALARMSVQDQSAVIRRIWTAHRLRTVTGQESRLSLWHLPAEKERAFASLFAQAELPSSWFWEAAPEEFSRRSGKLAGFHGRSPLRVAIDVAASTRRRIVEG